MGKNGFSNRSARGSRGFGERIAHLSVKRQELVRPIQERPNDYVLLPIRSLATRLSTDPATLLRVVRDMGFANYHEFKAYLHELSIAHATSLEGLKASGPVDTSLGSYGRKVLDQDIHNLHALRNTLDMNRVTALAKR